MSGEGKPIATCICVTQNRRLFLRQAVRYFERANERLDKMGWSSAEMVIVDGSSEPHPMAHDWCEDVRYYHEPSSEHSHTGHFHNRACELAKSDIIIHWDDDDWHSPYRIEEQVKSLFDGLSRTGGTGITFTSKFYWYHLLEKKAAESRTWHVGESSLGAMFAYHRKTWERIPFRDVEQGEDNWFYDDHLSAGTMMVDSKDPSLCLYVRHNRNGSPLVHTAYDERATFDARLMLRNWGDIDFYDELAEVMPLDGWNRPRPTFASPYQQNTSAMLTRKMRHK